MGFRVVSLLDKLDRPVLQYIRPYREKLLFFEGLREKRKVNIALAPVFVPFFLHADKMENVSFFFP